MVAALVACVWLNQSVGLLSWQATRARVFATPRAAGAIETARYPFVFLYRRSADEALYYGTASQILGRSYDRDVLELHDRGRVTPWFAAAPPPTDGRWHAPYSEVHLEYPPIVLPFVVAPRLLAPDFEGYAFVFGVLMGLCLLASIAVAVDALGRSGADEAEQRARWWIAAALLLAHGAIAIQRLDPIVALAMALAVHGAARRSAWQLGLFAALAGACKIVPLLVLPVIVASDWSGWRPRLARVAAWTLAGLAIGLLPMVVASPGAAVEVFRYHAQRGLHVESTLGALVGAVRWFAGTSRPAAISFGSFNLDGAVPDTLATLAMPLTIAGIAALAWRTRRAGPESSALDRAACAALGATIVVWLAGKVFSPQYLTWGIPLVLAVPGARGRRACLVAACALVLTQVYYRGFYDHVSEQRLAGWLAVLVRDAVLVALLVLVTRDPRGREREALPSTAR